MNVDEQIKEYLTSQPEPKRNEMEQLHQLILEATPGCKLWFDNGKDANGKIVSNPSIGYGQYTIKYADGKTREFFQIGLSANTAGLSIYIMGIKDKTYLPQTYGKVLGKANVTGYCIKFKKLADIDINMLLTAIIDGVRITT
ncbi:MAG: DUF1801 domain-containing protein [Bacteroidota bacterium]